MSSNLFASFLLIAAPFGIALIWARLTASPRLSRWLTKSVFWGAPLFAVLIGLIKMLTLTCTHQANFGFMACSGVPVTLANAAMTGFVFGLILCAIYGLALLGVGTAIEVQTRLNQNR